MIWIHVSKMEMVSILFRYSFQLIWKLLLDWYPNQKETVSFWKYVSKSVGYSFLLWILLAGIHSGLVTIGNTLWRQPEHSLEFCLVDGGQTDDAVIASFTIQGQLAHQVLRPESRVLTFDLDRKRSS